MANPTPVNYLRTYRKRSGLSQDEVAIILGCEDGGAVSRYELSHHFPPLPFAVAYEVMFRVPISELFGGLREIVGKNVEDRLLTFELELQTRSGKGPAAALTARKLMWLMERRDFQADA